MKSQVRFGTLRNFHICFDAHVDRQDHEGASRMVHTEQRWEPEAERGPCVPRRSTSHPLGDTFSDFNMPPREEKHSAD